MLPGAGGSSGLILLTYLIYSWCKTHWQQKTSRFCRGKWSLTTSGGLKPGFLLEPSAEVAEKKVTSEERPKFTWKRDSAEERRQSGFDDEFPSYLKANGRIFWHKNIPIPDSFFVFQARRRCDGGWRSAKGRKFFREGPTMVGYHNGWPTQAYLFRKAESILKPRVLGGYPQMDATGEEKAGSLD